MNLSTRFWTLSTNVFGAGVIALAVSGRAEAQTQPPPPPQILPEVTVVGQGANGAQAQYNTRSIDIGPLGNQTILDTPTSVTVVPEQLILNTQAKTVNDTLRYLPSVEIRDQQGLEVSRPQSRGFQGTIVQNTRLDGLNIIGTTAIPSENLSGIEVLNGLAGSLYGPETPAGVFNYLLKRPTDQPVFRFIESYDSNSIFTEQLDAGGRFGPDNALGVRLNVVHGEGESYVSGSSADRTLVSVAADYHFDPKTVVELDYSHYETEIDGLPGSIVYDSGKSTLLPKPVDPTTPGLGQPGAGTDLITSTGLVKIKHDFGDGWTFEAGGLYQDAVRNLFGITNTFTDNVGDYTTTKNFTAVPHFTVGSNSVQLNGHVALLGLLNDVTVATNGFINDQYSYRNSIATPLGHASLSDPVIYPTKPIPNNGGQYHAGSLFEQSIILGDTLHFNAQWSVQGVLSTSFISARSYAATGKTTSSDSRDGVVSPTVSLIYKPVPKLTTYFTYSNSVEQGEAAPAGTANANQFQAPYNDEQFELGAKYALTDQLLVTLDGFRMTRPLADTNAVTNIFAVVGTQRNQGAELFAQGYVTPDLSVLGGITYIDAKLQDTGVAATNNKLVVGVPRVKSDLALDYHPAFAGGFALTGAVHVESERAATNTNNSYASAYATVDLGARYSTKLFTHFATLRFQVINVGDKFYYSSVADGNIVGSPGANTAYFGAPRTFLASLEFDY